MARLGLGAEPTGAASAAPAAAETAEPPPGSEPPAIDAIEVFVQGVRVPGVESTRDPTVASFVLRRDELTEPGLTAAEALARVPGVQITRSGGSADLATAAVRGSTSAQTPIYLAGVRLNDDLTGTVDLSTIPLWMLNRIEAYRGNAPDHADQLGIGGAIVLEPQLPSSPRLGVGVGVGSFGHGEARASLAHGEPGAGTVLAIRRQSATNDFDFVDDRGTRFDERDDRLVRRHNADASSLDVWSISRIGLPISGSLTVALNAFDREAGAPGLQVVGARHSRAHWRRLLGAAAVRAPCSRAAPGRAGHCELEASTGLLVTRYRLHDPLQELGSATETTNGGERLTEGLRLRVAPADWLELRVGGLLESQFLRIAGLGVPNASASRQLQRLSLGGRAHAGSLLRLVAVGALECHTTSGSAGSGEACGALEPVGRVGARVQPVQPLAIFANVGRYARVPTLGELYGTSAVVRGNPELSAEQGVSVDLGVGAAGAVDWFGGYGQAAGFVRWADDLIGYRRSSFSVLRPYNTSAARVLGLEIAAGVKLTEMVRLSGTLTLLDPRDVTENRQLANDLLPFQARLVASPHLELAAPAAWRTQGIDRLSWGLRYTYRSSRVADPAGLIVLAEQGSLDTDIALRLGAPGLSLRGRVVNLLGQRNVDLVGYPLPGRSGHLEVEAWW